MKMVSSNVARWQQIIDVFKCHAVFSLRKIIANNPMLYTRNIKYLSILHFSMKFTFVFFFGRHTEAKDFISASDIYFNIFIINKIRPRSYQFRLTELR
jgi:hypothetical protein